MKRQIINASTELAHSNLSFDFSWQDDYDETAVADLAYEALEPYEVLGIDWVSMTDQYDGYNPEYPNVSQCDITFEHDGNYNARYIEDTLALGLDAMGMALEGLQFDSID